MEDGRSQAETRAVIGYRLCSAGIKATANGEKSVACPETRRDERRLLRLRK